MHWPSIFWQQSYCALLSFCLKVGDDVHCFFSFYFLRHGTPGHYSTNFEENVDGTVEHFDVYGEVESLTFIMICGKVFLINLHKVSCLTFF